MIGCNWPFRFGELGLRSGAPSTQRLRTQECVQCCFRRVECVRASFRASEVVKASRGAGGYVMCAQAQQRFQLTSREFRTRGASLQGGCGGEHSTRVKLRAKTVNFNSHTQQSTCHRSCQAEFRWIEHTFVCGPGVHASHFGRCLTPCNRTSTPHWNAPPRTEPCPLSVARGHETRRWIACSG